MIPLTSPEQLIKLMENPITAVLIIILAIWSMVWKGLALWKASRNFQKTWFIVLLVVNTMGILEILYLFYFSKRKDKNLPTSQI
ncbi:MAG: DUF5652 family protein [Candidatus Staskawiczbacteria bacterium]|jgi:hypothetical protein